MTPLEKMNAVLRSIEKLGVSTIAARMELEALSAHIVALAAERDAYNASLSKSCNEGAALRERVKAMEADVLAQCQATTRETVRADTAESRLTAIRQRAGDVQALHRVAFDAFDKRGAHVAEVADAVARFLVGEDATAPEYPPQTDDLDALEQWRENQKGAARAEPTTDEAFATVRKALRMRLQYITEGITKDDPAEATLALLERRMGARVRALAPIAAEISAVFDVHHPPRTVPLALRLTVGHGEDLLSALTDAPPVFTLEEVEGAVGRVLEDWQDEWTVDEGQRRVREHLTSLRSQP